MASLLNWFRPKGDPAQAILLFPMEMLDTLNEEGWPIKPGDLAENITTSGIPYDSDEHRLGKVRHPSGSICGSFPSFCMQKILDTTF